MCAAISGIALPIYYKLIRCFCPAAAEGSGNEKSIVQQRLGCAPADLCSVRNLPTAAYDIDLLQRVDQCIDSML